MLCVRWCPDIALVSIAVAIDVHLGVGSVHTDLDEFYLGSAHQRCCNCGGAGAGQELAGEEGRLLEMGMQPPDVPTRATPNSA